MTENNPINENEIIRGIQEMGLKNAIYQATSELEDEGFFAPKERKTFNFKWLLPLAAACCLGILFWFGSASEYQNLAQNNNDLSKNKLIAKIDLELSEVGFVPNSQKKGLLELKRILLNYRHENLSQNIKELEHFLETYPENAYKEDATYYLGLAYTKIGEWDKGGQLLKTLEPSKIPNKYTVWKLTSCGLDKKDTTTIN